MRGIFSQEGTSKWDSHLKDTTYGKFLPCSSSPEPSDAATAIPRPDSRFLGVILLVKRLLDGAMPGCPDIRFDVVDVRDVADLQLKAMMHPAARGERFLATDGDFLSVLQIAQILKDDAGDAAHKTRPLPNWLMRMVALFDPAVKQVLPELGNQKNASNEKARRLLGRVPRSPRDAVLATGRSLLELGLLKSGLADTGGHRALQVAACHGQDGFNMAKK